MLFHVVLFRPRPDLLPAARFDLVGSLEETLRSVPSIRRFQLGRRVRHGAGYEAQMSEDLSLAAIIEFDDLAGLREYLEHPAHRALGRRFMESLAASAIYDYEMLGQEGAKLLAEEPS